MEAATTLLGLRKFGRRFGSEQFKDDEVNSLGVEAALSMIRFYKREISPLLPKSCRYTPTCSEYSMIAYKKYGVVKGTLLTACRLCRCNPLEDLALIPLDGLTNQLHMIHDFFLVGFCTRTGERRFGNCGIRCNLSDFWWRARPLTL
ncbi:hypothetical protein OROGR_017526 [Orobanche gracilis]